MNSPLALHGPSVDELLARAQDGVRLAESKGADQAEVYLWQGRSHEALVSRRMRTIEESDRSGVSVRLVDDGRRSTATTSGTTPEEIRWAVETAARSAKLVPRRSDDPGFPTPPGRLDAPSQVHEALAAVDPERLLSLGDAVTDAIEASRASNYFTCRIGTHTGRFVVANTNGLEAWDHHAHEGLHMEVRAEQGDHHKLARGLAFGRAPLDQIEDAERVASSTIARAEAAQAPATLDAPADRIILDGACTAQLFDKLVPSLTGRVAHKGLSQLAQAKGQQIAPEALTLEDRPRGPGGCRHQRVDDEGVPTRNLPIIQDGVLDAYLYDWTSAQEAGKAPTGHGFRGLKDRYGAPPGAKAANLTLHPGGSTLEEMIEAAGKAVLVQDAFLGSFTMDRMAGDFSFVAPMAHLVEGGQVTQALVSTSVSGNLFEVLGSIRAIGQETATYPHGQFVPLSIEGATCVT